VQTDAQGNFSLPNPGGVSNVSIKITDPNAENPALAMRYINHWKGPVVVPAYTKDVDVTTMATLTLIPGCDPDLVALVCKLDDATLQVRDQYLNDTSVIPIDKGISIKTGEGNSVGLLQGFLTLPFMANQIPDPFINNYFDILGNYFWDDAGKNNFTTSKDNLMLNYDGKYETQADWKRVSFGERLTGVGDAHAGIDYLLPIGTNIVSGLPTAQVWYIFTGTQDDPELRINTWFEDPASSDEYFESGGGHFNVQLVSLDQTIYRGQIIGLSENSGITAPGYPATPQNHFGLGKKILYGWNYFDPYRTIITLNPIPDNYWGSPVSWWTSDNLPQFSR
jgi:hypothetical protein